MPKTEKKQNGNPKESMSLRFFYHTFFGRILLKVVASRPVSKVVGWFMDTRLSKPLIKKFVKKNGIDLSEYENDNFRCFNDCFSRKIKAENRPIDTEKSSFISPCDGLLSAYRIKDDTVLPIKQSVYTISDLLCNKEIADTYKDGICLVFRLCVNHYHRYCYVDDAKKGDNVFIKGKLHTVRPIALETYPVFVRNAREYTVMDTENFGKVTQIEVGALLVGKIKNHHKEATVKRGEEKGMFLYGGSTIVVLLEKDRVCVDEKYFIATENGIETDVKQGQKIGVGIAHS